MQIIDRIKKHCEEQGLTQGELAKRTGIHPVTISNILRGKTKKNVILTLDAYLDAFENSDNCQQTETAEV